MDWTQTKAYAVGLGQIYFNLRGREGQASSRAGAEYTALQNEMRAKLVELIDPKNGQPRVPRHLSSATTSTTGEYLRNAPDLQVGFNDGYRVGWQDTLGGVTQRGRRGQQPQVERRPLRDGHRDQRRRPVHRTARSPPTTPNIMDLSPTILKLLGVPLPADLDGKPLM